jgi:hypothetical protein
VLTLTGTSLRFFTRPTLIYFALLYPSYADLFKEALVNSFIVIPAHAGMTNKSERPQKYQDTIN